MKNNTFEEKMAQLDLIVKDLENSDIKLDDAVKKYKEGIKLEAEIRKMLIEAEEVIVKEIDDIE